jgi:hypothetical protein
LVQLCTKSSLILFLKTPQSTRHPGPGPVSKDVAQAHSVNGHSASSAQVIDRWWLQLGGLLFVEASEMQDV